MRFAPILALLAALGPLSATATAQSRVALATDATLGTRIRGQTADLAVELVEAPPITSFDEALVAGRNSDAPFVVFAAQTDASLTIHVVEVEARRMLTRRIGAEDDHSARLEAAALIVRGALRDLADGGHVGVAMPGGERTAAVMEAPLDPPPAPPDRGRGVGVHMEVGWSASLDDHAPLGVQAPSLAGVVAVERLRLGLRVEVGLPNELEDGRAVLEVMRVRPTLGVGVDLVDDPELGLTLGAELGVALWHRSTEVREAGLVATDARWTASLLIAPTVGLELFPAVFEGIVGLIATVGADIVPSAPTFAYQIDGASMESAALWPVQPWARLAIAVRGR